MIERHQFREAPQFHQMAWPFLSGLGFELVQDPGLILNSYLLTAATYRTRQGFFLTVGFDPADSNSAAISCGRQWLAKRGGFVLSGRYAALARRLGIEAPEYYELGYGGEIPRTMERILGDLKRTLLVLLQRVTRDDLLAIERENNGALSHAAAHGPLEDYEISEYQTN
jgi:hypothetical protein